MIITFMSEKIFDVKLGTELQQTISGYPLYLNNFFRVADSINMQESGILHRYVIQIKQSRP
jgi:hypothetical protein